MRIARTSFHFHNERRLTNHREDIDTQTHSTVPTSIARSFSTTMLGYLICTDEERLPSHMTYDLVGNYRSILGRQGIKLVRVSCGM